MISLIVTLVVVGVLLYLFRGWVDPTIYKLILILIILAVTLFILSAFGLFTLPSAFQLKGK